MDLKKIAQDASLNQDKVKRKTNKTPTKKQAVKIAKSKEVMSKLSGSTKSPQAMQEHINYISRNGKLELENEKGEKLTDKDRFAVGREWENDHKVNREDQHAAGAKGVRANKRLTSTMVFSMPPGTPPEAVKDAVRNLAKEEFGGKHKYLMALHTDTDSPHVHLCINTKGIERGQRSLHLSKEDTERIRQKFAEKMQEQGIDAEATPRAMRGVVRKGEKLPVLKQRERFREKGEVLDIDKAAIKEVQAERKGEIASKARPWEDRIHAEQAEIRKGWEDIYKELKAEGSKDAESVRAYIDKMPPVETKREYIERQLQERQQARAQVMQQDAGAKRPDLSQMKKPEREKGQPEQAGLERKREQETEQKQDDIEQ